MVSLDTHPGNNLGSFHLPPRTTATAPSHSGRPYRRGPVPVRRFARGSRGARYPVHGGLMVGPRSFAGAGGHIGRPSRQRRRGAAYPAGSAGVAPRSSSGTPARDGTFAKANHGRSASPPLRNPPPPPRGGGRAVALPLGFSRHHPRLEPGVHRQIGRAPA